MLGGGGCGEWGRPLKILRIWEPNVELLSYIIQGYSKSLHGANVKHFQHKIWVQIHS
jgi:hypothetical protein